MSLECQEPWLWFALVNWGLPIAGFAIVVWIVARAFKSIVLKD